MQNTQMIEVHLRKSVIDVLEKEELLVEGATPIWKRELEKA